MKRILLLAVLLQTVISVSASDFEVNSIHYNITRKTAPYTVEVTSAWPNSYKYSGDVVIPETVTYDGITYKVTAIGMGAFSGSKDLTSVVIPNTVVEIQAAAFTNCVGLKSLSIPNSVKTIGELAFASCHELETLWIGSSLAKIGSCAFEYAKSLTHIEVSEKNTHFKAVDNVLYSAKLDTLVLCPAGREGTFYTPYKVVAIGNYAFCSCEKITNVEFLDKLRSIGDSAFLYCTSLSKINIPKNVRNIGDCAFGFCTSLMDFDVDYKNKRYTSAIGVLYTKRMDTIVAYPIGRNDPTCLLPDAVRTIGNSAFLFSKITFIDLPNTVTVIENKAFRNCSTLVRISLGQSLERVGEESFMFCEDLKSVALPNSLKEIGMDAFAVCKSLPEIIIGDSVKVIGEAAFGSCESLVSITLGKSVEFVNDMAFMGSCTKLERLEFKSPKPPAIGFYAFYLPTSSEGVSVSLGYGNSKQYIPDAVATKVVVPCGKKQDYTEYLLEWFDDIQENCE